MALLVVIAINMLSNMKHSLFVDLAVTFVPQIGCELGCVL